MENAVFSLYERFDDKDQIDTGRDGAAHLYAGGAPYKSYHKDSPVFWEDFRFVSPMMTDGAGEAEKTVEHGYHYDKTFCDGHPAPVFVPVPEEEEDEETGEIENQAEIDAAKEENRRLGSSVAQYLCFLRRLGIRKFFRCSFSLAYAGSRSG
ncbi:MAG: hypothetical protein V8S58_10580 [Lachnospiraceae bacterium]